MIQMNFEIDDEEKVQIVYIHSPADAHGITCYNIDLNKKSVIYSYRSISYGPGNGGKHYSKHKYKLTDKDVVAIKEKLEKLKDLSDENKLNGLINGGQHYEVITMEGAKEFSYNEEALTLIKDIIDII